MMNRIGVTFWNIKASFYYSIRSLPPFKKVLKQEISHLKMLMKQASLSPMKVLDVGMGVGSTLEIFPEGARIIGLDHAYDMIWKSRDKKKVIGVVGNAQYLPFQNHVVPFVSAVGFTEYLFNKETFLDEVKRIIRSDGHFLVTIAPPGFFNFLRHFFGHRIYPIRAEAWESLVAQRGFSCIGKTRTWLQQQHLFIRKEVPIS
ncbi:class I SAM-dependent methyltransferase [bacterium]|nr:class I SAM-dependent methyltransferase [bacterium]